MASWPHILFAGAILALALVAASALLHRVMGRMALRNALRRPRQSSMVVAGLMVGTMIVSGALVASDSLDESIRQATFDSFGRIDQTVILEGFNFFPEAVADELASHPGLAEVSLGVAPQAIWSGAVTNLATDRYEPNVRLIGFDPARDEAFGPFLDGGTTFWGHDLGPEDVILTRELAQALDASPGDRLQLNTSRPMDPLLPSVRPFSGQITAAGSGLPLVGDNEATAWSGTFAVDPNAVHVVVVIGWPSDQADLDLTVRAPDGTVREERGGAVGGPDAPAIVGFEGTIAAPLPRGDWEVIVEAKAAVDEPFEGVFIVLYAEYDLARIQERLAEFPEDGLPFDLDPSAPAERTSATLTVRHVTDGGKGRQFLQDNTLFLRLDALQDHLDRQGQVNIVRVSNAEDPRQGPERAAVVLPVLQEALNASKANHPDLAAVQALRAQDDKVFWLDVAETTGELFTLFLAFISSFAVIAGLLLILNIFTMLAEERKSELGMARALGLRRRHLVRLFLYEGTLYALPAAAIGVFAGLGLAAALVWGFNHHLTGLQLPPIPFHVRTTSLMLAFAVGTLLTLGTVWLAARRSSQLNIVRAIRRQEDPEILRTRRATLATAVLGLFGVAGVAAAVATGSFAWQVVGPTALALAVGLGLRRRYPRRRIYPMVSLALFAYLAATLFLIREYDTTTANYFGPLRAIILAACLAVVLLYNERATRAMAWVVGRIRGLGAVALPATSYPLHKKFRTGMTLLMFAVILLMVSLFSIFGNLFMQDPEKEMGGYHLRGHSELPITGLEGLGHDPSALAAVDYYEVLPSFFKLGGDLVTVEGQGTGQFGPPRDTVWGVDGDFAERNEFRLVFRHPDFATDRDAYRAVAERDDVVIVSYHYSTSQRGEDFAFAPGDTLQVHARGSAMEFMIIGVQEQFHFKGVFVRQDLVSRLFTNTGTTFLFALHEPAQAQDVAIALQSSYRDIGLEAVDLRAEIVEEQQQFRQLLSMVQLFLGLGLVVGVLSLGIVTARNVVERRQEIGMLRALGYRRAHIRRIFLLEMFTTVALGVLIGTFVAILVSYGLWSAVLQDFDVPYRLPWVELAAIAAIAFLTTTVATLSPIFRAARTSPAEAVRYIE